MLSFEKMLSMSSPELFGENDSELTKEFVFCHICMGTDFVYWKKSKQCFKNISYFCPIKISSKGLTHLPLDKMAAILADDLFKRIFLNEKKHKFLLKFHWSLFLMVQLTKFHCRHYLNQFSPSSPMHICGTRGRWVK